MYVADAGNEDVHRRVGIERELASKARVLRLFGHVERMDDYRMARRVLMAEISGGRVRGRQRLGWMDGVKVASGNRNDCVGCASMREKSKRVESPGTYVTERVSRGQFCLALFFRTALLYSGGDLMERGGINCKKGTTTEN